MKKIIITGSLGQDGIILSKLLKKKGYSVYGFINKNRENKLRNVSYFLSSNKKELKKQFDIIQPDIIIHLGSHNPSFGSKFLQKHYQSNFKFTKNIINYVGINRNIKLILVSTSQIFKISRNMVNENSSIKIQNKYSKFRSDSTKYMLSIKKKFKLNSSVLILFNHDSKYRNKRFLLPRLMHAIKFKKIQFIKDIYKENIIADFSHAEDICYAIYLLIKKNKNPDKLILSSAKQSKINDIVDFYCKKFKKFFLPLNIKKNNSPLIGNNLKAKKLLNWYPRKNLFHAANEIYKNLKKNN
jgi:GDP-D-mannose dehydratase